MAPFFTTLVNTTINMRSTNENSDTSLGTAYAWEEPNELGKYEETSDDNRGICVVGNIAYIADDDLGLLKINISDPKNPQKLGSFNNDFSATSSGEEVEVANGLAYVADGDDGMEIINVTTMHRVGNFIDGTSYGRGIDVVGNIAYLADDTDGLEIINVSDPTSPSKLGNYTVGGSAAAYDVQVVGSVAFIAFRFEGLHIVNITDSANPRKIANFTKKDSNYQYPEALVVVGDYVYCAFYSSGGLGIIDVTDLGNPTLVSQVRTFNPGAFTYGIAVENDVAILATQYGIRTFNITDVKNPTLLRILNISGGQTFDVAIVGNLVYTCSGQAGLHILEAYNSTWEAWAKVGLLSQYISPYSNIDVLHIEGDVAFLGGSSHTLEIVNISDVHNPTYISHVNISENTFYNAKDIDVEGDLAFVAFRRGGVAIFNVSDLSNPVNTANITLTYNSTIGVFAQGELLYLTDQYSTRMISVYNCSDPYSPIQLHSSSGTAANGGIDLDGQLAFIGTNTEVRIMNFSDVSSPILIASMIGIGQVYDLVVEWPFLYVVSSIYNLSVWDVSDPKHPVNIGNLTYGFQARSVAVLGNIIFMGTQLGGFVIINGSDLTDLRIITAYHNNTIGISPSDLVARGQYLFTACGVNGMMIFEGFAPKIRDPLPTNNSYLANSSSNFITWSNLTDNIASGKYTVFRNDTVINSGSWSHGGDIQVAIDTNIGLGLFNYTLQFNDSAGIDGQVHTVWITINDGTDPFVDNLEVGGPYEANSTGNMINWTLGDNAGPGYYRVLVNDSVHPDHGWTTWANTTPINVDVLTNIGLGAFNYTIEFNDTQGNTGVDTTWITIVDNTDPYVVSTSGAATHAANATSQTVNWTLGDKVAPGYYWVLVNSTERVSATPWVNNSEIVVPVFTNIGLGVFNYTIVFNDSRSNMGTPNTVWITIEDQTAPTSTTPDDASYEQNSTGHTITWTLNDNVAGGFYRVFRNGIEVQAWTGWTSGLPIVITVNTNIGLGVFNYTIVFNDSVGLEFNDTVLITVTASPTENLIPIGPGPEVPIIILVIVLACVGGAAGALYFLHVKGFIDLSKLKPSSSSVKGDSSPPKDPKPAEQAQDSDHQQEN